MDVISGKTVIPVFEMLLSMQRRARVIVWCVLWLWMPTQWKKILHSIDALSGYCSNISDFCLNRRKIHSNCVFWGASQVTQLGKVVERPSANAHQTPCVLDRAAKQHETSAWAQLLWLFIIKLTVTIQIVTERTLTFQRGWEGYWTLTSRWFPGWRSERCHWAQSRDKTMASIPGRCTCNFLSGYTFLPYSCLPACVLVTYRLFSIIKMKYSAWPYPTTTGPLKQYHVESSKVSKVE